MTLPHLFRSISYSFSAKYHAESIHDEQPTLARLHTFFQDRPALASFVRQLRLKANPTTFGSGSADLRLLLPEIDYHDPRLLLAVIKLFPRLDALHLHDVFVTSPIDDLRDERLSLQHLEIRSTQDEIPDSDVSILLECFADVENVNINVHCFFEYHRSGELYPGPQYLSIRNLVSQGSPPGVLFTHISVSPSARTLRSLTLHNLEGNLLPGVQALLSATRENLTTLIVTFNGMWQDEYGECSRYNIASLVNHECDYSQRPSVF